MLLIISTVLILILGYIYIRHGASNSIPGPWNLPIIGYLHKLNPQEPDLGFSKLSRKYGPIFRIKLGLYNTVVISDAQLLRKILLKDETIGRPPLILFKIFFKNKGVAFSTGQLWKDQRKLAITYLKTSGASKIATNRKTIENLINEKVKDFIENLNCQSGSVTLDPSMEVGRFVFNIMIRLFVGESSYLDNDQKKKTLKENFDKAIQLVAVGGLLNYLPFMRFLPSSQKTISLLTKITSDIYKTLEQIVIEKKQLFSKDGNHSTLIDAFLLQKGENSIDQPTTMEELQNLLYDMVGAGIESSPNALLWILLFLANYKEVQEKVRQELADNLHGAPPEIEDLPRLPYTEATIAEVFRIRTVAPLGIPYCVIKDVTVDNITLQKNTLILGSLWGIHMDPNVWPEPEQFRPERFLDASGKFYQPSSFVPFHTGKRKCVGEDLAKVLFFLFIGNLLQNFKIECCETGPPDLNGIGGITYRPKPQQLVFVKI